jgi:hypothetical protein
LAIWAHVVAFGAATGTDLEATDLLTGCAEEREATAVEAEAAGDFSRFQPPSPTVFFLVADASDLDHALSVAFEVTVDVVGTGEVQLVDSFVVCFEVPVAADKGFDQALSGGKEFSATVFDGVDRFFVSRDSLTPSVFVLSENLEAGTRARPGPPKGRPPRPRPRPRPETSKKDEITVRLCSPFRA